jgi:CRP-like cAMP-binding protein
MMNDVERIAGVLRFASYFRTWRQEDILKLARLCEWVRLDADTEMFCSGQPALAMYLIVNGHVELSFEDCDSKSGLIDLLGDGQLVGECALIPSGRYVVSVRTLEATTAIRIDGAGFSDFLADHFDCALTMMSAMTERLRQMLRQAEELKCRSAVQRLGIYLLADAVVTNGIYETPLTIEKSALARKLGMTSETISRAFKKLTEVGVSQHANGRIFRIENVETLAEWCGIAEREGEKNEFKTAV